MKNLGGVRVIFWVKSF